MIFISQRSKGWGGGTMVSNFDPLQAVCAPDTTGDLSPESAG